MKTCPKCKTTGIPNVAKFCPVCGTKLNDSDIRKFIRNLVLYSCFIAGFTIGIGAIINRKAQQYKEEFALKAPTGFSEDSGNNWGAQDYNQSRDKDCAHSILYDFEWWYDQQDELGVSFCMEQCVATGKLVGYAHYGRAYSNELHHEFRIRGTVVDGLWKFDTYDRAGHRFDHYEGRWVNYQTFSGVCTNKKGTRINLSATSR